MKKVIIDTNALMAIEEFRMDIFRELEKCCDFRYKVLVLGGTVDELKKITNEQRGKYKRAAKLALMLIGAKKVGIIEHGDKCFVDDLLVEYSKKGYLILTQDIALKRRLVKPYLTIRQKNRIVLVR